MGVPGFFAWILKRHRNNNIIIPKMDKKCDILYLDANCLFHPQCFKVLDKNIDWKNQIDLEGKMINRILNYIQFLVKEVKPKKGLYIAVDGVAPMAKMNQQRKRRYRSINDTIIKNNIKKKHGIKTGKCWSNSVITPGTEFMERLHQKLLTYSKYMKDEYKIRVTYSSYHTPGEGEHKILQDIKIREREKEREKSSDVYVIYGLDADLIFLALASNKRNIYLLREIVEFGAHKKITKDSVEESMNYVNIDIFREYLNKIFLDMIDSKGYYADKGVDFTNDFIFISYLMGNDFIPHLPSVDIKTGGLDFIIRCYIDTYILLGVPLINIIKSESVFGTRSTKPLQKVAKLSPTMPIKVNNIFFEMMLTTIAKAEDYYFETILPKHKDKLSRYRCRSSDPYDQEMWELEHLRCFDINDPIKLGEDSSSLWKWRYYEHYCGVSEYSQHTIDNMCQEYLKGILWTTYYYFEKCPTWKWQYIYLHAPFISDIAAYYSKNKIDINSIQFAKTKSLAPCEQLLAVIPPGCAYMLPKKYQQLIVSDTSQLIDMYPSTINLDMINKDMYWKCIPDIPHIDVNRLLNAIKQFALTKKEKIRNTILDNIVYD